MPMRQSNPKAASSSRSPESVCTQLIRIQHDSSPARMGAIALGGLASGRVSRPVTNPLPTENQRMFSVKKLSAAVSACALTTLTGCGDSSTENVADAPPGVTFSNAYLSGTYVFSL